VGAPEVTKGVPAKTRKRETMELRDSAGPPGPRPADLTGAIHETQAHGERLVRRAIQPQEFKVVSIRECATPQELQEVSNPAKAHAYWDLHVRSHPFFNSDIECLVVLLLTARCRVKGHCFVSTGTLDSVVAHPREIFRAAIVAGAHSIALMHNHPSGDPVPSEADVKFTRRCMEAGKILGIEVRDHVIVAGPNFASLRALGYFSE
jgi:DNA repair protein RadC